MDDPNWTGMFKCHLNPPMVKPFRLWNIWPGGGGGRVVATPSWNLNHCSVYLLSDRPTLALPEYKLKVVNIWKMHEEAWDIVRYRYGGHIWPVDHLWQNEASVILVAMLILQPWQQSSIPEISLPLVSNIESDFTFENFQNFVIRNYILITSENLEYSLTNSLLW